MPPDPQPLATVQQVADYLGVPVATIYNWRARNAGPPAARIGRHLRFRWADVESWAQDAFASDRSAG